MKELESKKKWFYISSIFQIIAIMITITSYIFYFTVYLNNEGEGLMLLFPWLLFVAIGQKRLAKKSLLSLANKRIDTLRLDYENNIIDEESYRDLTRTVRSLIYKVS